MLSDVLIRRAMDEGGIVIDPVPDDWCMQPASVDVHLGSSFVIGGRMHKVTAPRGEVYLHPREFMLGCLMERLTLSGDYAARVEGKSSLGRRGLAIHVTAGFVDPGWDGVLTLELYNFSDTVIPLVPGMPIAQLAFEWLEVRPARLYGDPALLSRYQGADSVGEAL